jgi:hypothetical protein
MALPHTITNGTPTNATEVQENFDFVRPPVGGVISWLKDYTNTPALPSEWVECNGQTLNDEESPYHNQVIPDLNGSSGTKRFLRGSTSSGSTGGSETHTHSLNTFGANGQTGGPSPSTINNVTGSTSTLPSYYEVVWIIRIK